MYRFLFYENSLPIALIKFNIFLQNLTLIMAESYKIC
jgi:hypothetical protein